MSLIPYVILYKEQVLFLMIYILFVLVISISRFFTKNLFQQNVVPILQSSRPASTGVLKFDQAYGRRYFKISELAHVRRSL